MSIPSKSWYVSISTQFLANASLLAGLALSTGNGSLSVHPPMLGYTSAP